MQHSHAALDRLLHRSRARRWKVHRPHLRFGHVFVMMPFVISQGDGSDSENCEEEKKPLHGVTTGF